MWRRFLGEILYHFFPVLFSLSASVALCRGMALSCALHVLAAFYKTSSPFFFYCPNTDGCIINHAWRLVPFLSLFPPPPPPPTLLWLYDLPFILSTVASRSGLHVRSRNAWSLQTWWWAHQTTVLTRLWTSTSGPKASVTCHTVSVSGSKGSETRMRTPPKSFTHWSSMSRVMLRVCSHRLLRQKSKLRRFVFVAYLELKNKNLKKLKTSEFITCVCCTYVHQRQIYVRVLLHVHAHAYVYKCPCISNSIIIINEEILIEMFMWRS